MCPAWLHAGHSRPAFRDVAHLSQGSLSAALPFGRQVKGCQQRSAKQQQSLQASTLDQYEGQKGDKEFQTKYMNPNAHSSDPSDAEFDHPADLEMPTFHPMPMKGFMSDPCGPMYDPNHDRYHLFFQNVTDSIEWKFGIEWAHVTSKDLIHWEHCPPALRPGFISPEKEGFYKWDADGCFTGCATVDLQGHPTILYTGVRLRNNEKAGPFPEGDDDMQQPFFEAQLNAARADPHDEFLKVWTKEKCEALAVAPPKELRPASDHTGWRDPFIFQLPSEKNGMKYVILLGNGSQEKGGRVLVYRSSSLTQGWEYAGLLCSAQDTDNGNLWEYPVLAKLPQARMTSSGRIDFHYGNQEVAISSEADEDHVFLTGPDAPVNPCIYWVGKYDAESFKFLLPEAKGPYRFDIGEVLYAVNSMKDNKGRQILWGWLQEGERDDHGYSYSGCQSLPRELMLLNDRIVQRPIEEIAGLREDNIMSEKDLQEVKPGNLIGLPNDAGNALEILVTLKRGSSKQCGILVGSWAKGGRGTCALLYDWERNYLEGIFDTHFVCPRTSEIRQQPFGKPNQDFQKRTVGGPLEPKPTSDELQLRVFLDGSCLEVFTGTGAALTTRVYRGMRPKDAPSDIGFMALGGDASIKDVDVWKVKDCWIGDMSWRSATKDPCGKHNLTSASKLSSESEYGHDEYGRCRACRGLHKEGQCPVFKNGEHPD